MSSRSSTGAVGSSPFTSLGIDWCTRCKMEVDSDTEAHMKGNTFVYRRRCNRCGYVFKWGVYNQICILTNKPLPAAACEWVVEPGEDRR